MLREVALEAIGDDGFLIYGLDNRDEAIERLVGVVMRDGQRSLTHELIRGMLDDGSIVMTTEGMSVKFEKGNI